MVADRAGAAVTMFLRAWARTFFAYVGVICLVTGALTFITALD